MIRLSGLMMIALVVIILANKFLGMVIGTRIVHNDYSLLVWMNILWILEAFRQSRIEGKLTAAGLQGINGKTETVSYDSIRKLTVSPTVANPLRKDIFSVKLALHRDGGAANDMSLRPKDMVDMAKTGLNQWVAGYESIEVTQGDPGSSLCITYSDIGKYSVESSLRLLLYLMLPFYTMFVWIGSTDYFFSISLSFLLIIGLILLLRGYRKVTVRLDDAAISITDEDGRRHEAEFRDVITVERGCFQTKVTTRDGGALHFPRACYLLAEIVEEYAGLRKA